ncbi:MAG: response regulator [Bdellovibrionales bacterium]
MNSETVGANDDGGLYTILLVEDCAADTVLTKCRVRDLWPDSKVVPVRSLEDAYKTYAEHNFNLVLLDLNLPDSHGAETVKEIRNFNQKVPIVVLTGLAFLEVL